MKKDAIHARLREQRQNTGVAEPNTGVAEQIKRTRRIVAIMSIGVMVVSILKFISAQSV